MRIAAVHQIPLLAWTNATAFSRGHRMLAVLEYPASVLTVTAHVLAGTLYTTGGAIAALAMIRGRGSRAHRLRRLGAALGVALMLLVLVAGLQLGITGVTGSTAWGAAAAAVVLGMVVLSAAPTVVRSRRITRAERHALGQVADRAGGRVWLLGQVARSARAPAGAGQELLVDLLALVPAAGELVVCTAADGALVGYYRKFGFLPAQGKALVLEKSSIV